MGSYLWLKAAASPALFHSPHHRISTVAETTLKKEKQFITKHVQSTHGIERSFPCTESYVPYFHNC